MRLFSRFGFEVMGQAPAQYQLGRVLPTIFYLLLSSGGGGSLLGGVNNAAEAHRILVAFPHAGQSHFKVVEPFLLELAAKGHQMVVISQFPRPKPVPNYTDIDVRSTAESLMHDPNNKLDISSIFREIPMSLYSNLEVLYGFILANDDVLSSANFQKLIRSKDEHFDLLIVESFHTRVFYALAHRFQVPNVIYSTTMLFPHTTTDVGNPVNPAYIRGVMSGLPPGYMTFWQRLSNVCHYIVVSLSSEYFDWVGERQKEKYFGAGYPTLKELAKNVSLTLVNTHFSMNGIIPLLPGIVEVGGSFVKPSKPLPQDIEKFLNESEHGVIYFSLGSMLKGASMSSVVRDAFLKAFSEIPQRVLWKWEEEDFSLKNKNMMIKKWMPQRDILAHPNVKLFITHGGLLGCTEAIYEGVPVIGIPFFGDQPSNLRALEHAGVAEILHYSYITKETVLGKISLLINDTRYHENAQKLSERFKDRPLSPLDTAIYWTEYVIKHKGAFHLRSEVLNMPWYSYLLLDIIAFIFMISILLYYIVKKSLILIFRGGCSNNNTNEKLSDKKIK